MSNLDKLIKDLRYESKMQKKEAEIKKRIFLAVNEKENEMFNKFEKWLGYIEDRYEESVKTE